MVDMFAASERLAAATAVACWIASRIAPRLNGRSRIAAPSSFASAWTVSFPVIRTNGID